MRSKILFFIIACLFISKINSQTVLYPIIDYPYEDTSGKCDIKMIGITDEYTIVYIDYATLRYEPWISISSKTKIFVDGTKISYGIVGWGSYINENYEPLEFDTRYSTERDRSYGFILTFPRISTTYKKITIRENIPNEFIWRGIHMDYAQNENNRNNKNSDNITSIRKQHSNNQTNTMKAYGTGFALSSSGFIATDYHVVKGANRIKIRGINSNFSTTYNAEVVITDKNNDLAILKINDDQFTSLGRIPYIIDDQYAYVGDDIFVLGYPLRATMGDEIKLTNGIISSNTGFMGNATMYQISAAVQPGNSGGPLFDYKGDLIGIITAKHSEAESVSYAVKSTYLLNLMQSIDYSIPRNKVNILDDLSLSDKARRLKRFIYIIEVY